MLHFALIDDCFPINTRNRKILQSLANYYGDSAKLSVITWDRSNTYCKEKDGYHVYKKLSAYGNKILKLMNLWGYRKFCHSVVRKLHPDVVIASHWNNLLMVPRLDRRCQMFIYENLDIPTDAYLFRQISTLLERVQMHRVDLTIHASRFFKQFYPTSCNQIVLENKPVMLFPTSQEYQQHCPIRIAFIGLLRYREVLCVLIDALQNDNRFELRFHGNGPDMQYLKEYAEGTSNIFFTGQYEYEDVARFYEEADVIWAAYPNRDFNVKYAISNKFHESLIFSKPCVYADNTDLGDFVEEQHIGMAVNPYSRKAVRTLLNRIADGQDDLRQMSVDMKEYNEKQTTWKDDFKRVTDSIDSFFAQK